MKKSTKTVKNQDKSTNITEIFDKFKENYRLRNKISKLINQWKEIMSQTNTYNQEFLTFTLSHIQEKDYGFKCRIYAPYGLSFDMLEKLKPIIENNLNCMFLYDKKKLDSFIMTRIVLTGFGSKNGKDVLFIPPKISPCELYLGKSIDGENVIISVKDICHFLLSGSNGSGKSRMLDCMLTSLIYNCTEKELELYLVQISKNDLVIYEDAIQTRAFCETLEEAEIMFEHIIDKMKDRDKLIKPMRKDFKGSNITDYNKLHPHNQLSICWIIFDEMASLMNKMGNVNNIKQQKDRIIAMAEEIARVGRALGIFLGCCLQRPKADSLSSDIKAQANLRISFSQNNEKSSEIAMDDGKIAVGLDERVAVYSCKGSGYDFVKTPYIDDSIIAKYIKPKCKRGHRNLFTDLKKLQQDKRVIQNIDNNHTSDSGQDNQKKGTISLPKKETKKEVVKTIDNPINSTPSKPYIELNFDNVDKDIAIKKERSLKNNIANIPNFVPYVSDKLKDITIIDKTNIILLPSQKPRKNNKESL